MVEIIMNNVYVNTIEGSIKHHKDELGNHWYDYRDLCDEVLIPDRERKNIFYNWIDECDRKEVRFDCSLVKLISAEGFRQIIERNFERGMKIYKDLINLEFRGEEFDNLKDKFDELGKAISNGDVMEIFNNFELIHSDVEYKEALCNYNPNFNMYNEAVIENIRYEMYNDQTDEIILKKKGCDQVIFKKNPKYNGQSTCPSWLRDVVK